PDLSLLEFEDADDGELDGPLTRSCAVDALGDYDVPRGEERDDLPTGLAPRGDDGPDHRLDVGAPGDRCDHDSMKRRTSVSLSRMPVAREGHAERSSVVSKPRRSAVGPRRVRTLVQ